MGSTVRISALNGSQQVERLGVAEKADQLELHPLR